MRRVICWGLALIGLAGAAAPVAAAPYRKGCGVSVSDGFWGLFSRHNLITSALTAQADGYLFGTADGAIRLFSPSGRSLHQLAERDSGISSPLYQDEKMICGGEHRGLAFCLEKTSGRELWARELAGEVRAQPQAREGMIFFTTLGSYVYALDQKTGKWLWQYRRDNPNAITLLGTAAVLPLADRVITGFADGTLAALGIHDGQPLWEKKIGGAGKIQDVDASPVPLKDSFLAASFDGQVMRLDREGRILWSASYGLARPPLVSETEGLAYLGTADGRAVALELAGGQVRWEKNLAAAVLMTPAANDRHLLIAAADGQAYLLEKNSGRLRWTYRTDSGLSAGAVADRAGSFYLLSQRGEFFCLDGSPE